MSQNRNLIEGTNIPQDPRKRSKGHGRLEIVVWYDLPTELLRQYGFESASEMLRAFASDDNLARKTQLGEVLSQYAVHSTVRASQ